MTLRTTRTPMTAVLALMTGLFGFLGTGLADTWKDTVRAAVMASKAGDLRGSLDLYKQALQIPAEDPSLELRRKAQVYIRVGLLFERAEKLKPAVKAFKKALDILVKLHGKEHRQVQALARRIRGHLHAIRSQAAEGAEDESEGELPSAAMSTAMVAPGAAADEAEAGEAELEAQDAASEDESHSTGDGEDMAPTVDPDTAFADATAKIEAGNVEEGLKELEALAATGHPASIASLADIKLMGSGTDPDYAGAIELYTRAAEAGSARAQFQLGLLHREGKGTEANEGEAFRRFQAAAESGMPEAQHEVGLHYLNGQGTEQDKGKAMAAFQQAAESGYSNSQHNLAVAYQEGWGGEPNPTEAMRWYRTAAEAGNADSAGSLGYLYMSGNGVQANMDEARRWFERAAQGGNAGGEFGLAFMQERGMGQASDINAAIVRYKELAGRGHPQAQERLRALGAM